MRYLLLLLLSFTATVAHAQHPTDVLKDPRFKYENAMARYQVDEKPLIVVLGATWCGPCQVYKADAVVKLANEIVKGRAGYHLAIIDVDEDRPLADKVLNGDKFQLPYTAIYYSTRKETKKKHFYEVHSLEFVKLVLKDIESQRK